MKGRLNTTEFIVFLDSIDLSFSHEDLEIVLQELDENHDNEVGYHLKYNRIY